MAKHVCRAIEALLQNCGIAKGFNARRADVAALLDALCRATDFRVQEVEIAKRAIDLFRAGRADFADCLIGLANRAAGCEAALTLDGAAANLDAFAPIRPA